MPDLSKVYVSTETLSLATGSATYTTTFECDIDRVDVTGVVGATEVVVNVDGTNVATINLTNGAGSAVTTGGPGSAASAVASNVNAQLARTNNTATSVLGVVKQANATDVGYADYIGPEVDNQKPVADNVAVGKVVTLTATGATAGSAVLTLDKAGAAVGVNNNLNTDSSY